MSNNSVSIYITAKATHQALSLIYSCLDRISKNAKDIHVLRNGLSKEVADALLVLPDENTLGFSNHWFNIFNSRELFGKKRYRQILTAIENLINTRENKSFTKELAKFDELLKLYIDSENSMANIIKGLEFFGIKRELNSLEGDNETIIFKFHSDPQLSKIIEISRKFETLNSCFLELLKESGEHLKIKSFYSGSIVYEIAFTFQTFFIIYCFLKKIESNQKILEEKQEIRKKLVDFSGEESEVVKALDREMKIDKIKEYFSALLVAFSLNPEGESSNMTTGIKLLEQIYETLMSLKRESTISATKLLIEKYESKQKEFLRNNLNIEINEETKQLPMISPDATKQQKLLTDDSKSNNEENNAENQNTST